jgi:ferredoxin-NADP reductase
MSDLKVGTRVIAEGPYGVFTASSRRTNKVLAVAAGIGITPIRALLEDLPYNTEATLLYRVSDPTTAPLREELENLVGRNNWKLHYLVGSRELHPMTVNHLTELVPSLPGCDVYVCGPKDFTDAVLSSAKLAGVTPDRIHHESFEF